MNPLTGPVPSGWLTVIKALPSDRYVAALVIICTVAIYFFLPHPRFTNFKQRLLVFVILCVVCILLILGPDYLRAKNLPDQHASDKYSITGQYSGIRETHTSTPIPFRISSGQVNFGCEQSVPVNVSYQLPPHASLLNQQLKWDNTNNTTALSADQPSLQGESLSGSGVIRGLNFEHFAFGIKNCPGGGHGELVLSGAYSVDQVTNEPVSSPLPLGVLTSVQRPLLYSLPHDPTLHLKDVELKFDSDGSADPKSDELVLDLSAATLPTSQASKEGRFTATVSKDLNLRVDFLK